MKTDDVLAGHWEPLDGYFGSTDLNQDDSSGEYDLRNDADAVTD